MHSCQLPMHLTLFFLVAGSALASLVKVGYLALGTQGYLPGGTW
jgi:hypothetical protein